jgi:hypothetical protein
MKNIEKIDSCFEIRTKKLTLVILVCNILIFHPFGFSKITFGSKLHFSHFSIPS